MNMSLADKLKVFIDNPDDLSTLPNIIDMISSFEKEVSENEANYQMRIDKLQAANRNYLAQIPMEQQEPESPESQLPTEQDAIAHLLSVARGGN